MKITSIRQQQRDKERYSVFVDSKFMFSLSESELLNQKLVTGQELTKTEVREYKKLSQNEKIYQQVLRYGIRRKRSTWEITQYLEKKQIPSVVGDKALKKLQELGIVDDNKFAKEWVENRQLLHPRSKRKLMYELKSKRINTDNIAAALEQSSIDDRKILYDIVIKKRNQQRYKQDHLKLMRYLAAQGFSYEDIKYVFQELNIGKSTPD